MRDGGAHVLEIVTSFGDDVLDVRHAPPQAADARLVPAAGETVRVEQGGLTLAVRWTDAAPRLPRGSRRPLDHTAWLAVSFALHAGLVALLWTAPPRFVPIHRPMNVPAVPIDLGEHLAAVIPGTGEAHLGREGRLGSRAAPRDRGRFAVRGRAGEPAPRLARARGSGSIESIGALGEVRAMMGSWSAPTSPYGARQARGYDEHAALGAMMAARIADAPGMDGLGMRGTGRGGGGTGEGTLGLGMLGTIGHGANGVREGEGSGYGRGAGGLRARESRAPIVRCGGSRGGCGAVTMGSLSREAIRRVVRSRLAEVRFCYEQGLVRRPRLEGGLTVQWIIGADGRVESAALSSSDLGDAAVEQCVVGAVRRWSFPATDLGGPTGVTYPFVLAPS
ncbi:MAG: AgmX/PglI C-terminal domain-containing protein [Sandaracinaceae bacterium]|nr:AgmX/PglI C-terminal domain-containing protein [Sandaracinaceae bacterium]